MMYFLQKYILLLALIFSQNLRADEARKNTKIKKPIQKIEVIKNPTQKQKELINVADRQFKESKKYPPPSKHMQNKMQSGF